MLKSKGSKRMYSTTFQSYRSPEEIPCKLQDKEYFTVTHLKYVHSNTSFGGHKFIPLVLELVLPQMPLKLWL